MNKITIQRLNAINREFYQKTADEFDQTRGKAWPGWKILLPYFNFQAQRKPFSVLDVGCGNGRFGVFMAEYLEAPVVYHGVDNNETLLNHARKALDPLPNITATLEQRDVVLSPPETGEYDLVVLFGLIHHIPGRDNRQTFVRRLARRVKPRGFLVFASWRFYDFERFKQRIIPWADDLAGLVETHDYLLDWRRGDLETGKFAQRYCHFVDDAEHTALIAASGMREIHSFRADGFTNTVNKYALLNRV